MANVDDIAKRLEELEKRFATAERERDEYRTLYLETMEQCRKLERGILSSKSERLPPSDDQLSLGVLAMVLDDRQRAALDEALDAAKSDQEVKAHTRKPPTGRKPLPVFLPRVDILVLPPEVEKKGLDAFERIGEDVSETIERRPASMVVARVIRPKFIPKDRERGGVTKVAIADPLELPIPRGLAGPGMLADTIVKCARRHDARTRHSLRLRTDLRFHGLEGLRGLAVRLHPTPSRRAGGGVCHDLRRSRPTARCAITPCHTIETCRGGKCV